MNPVELNLFASRMTAVCEEMGTVLRRTAFSPNIKDRLDFSCAVFDSGGELCAQAAHIPVHLGSMAFAMASVVSAFQWRPDDIVVLNDPFLGGTHLPDVTVISPVFGKDATGPAAFVANRAHHADIGCDSPGSMPVSFNLDQEGRLIPPVLLIRDGQLLPEALALVAGAGKTRLDPDFDAQISASRVGAGRLETLIRKFGTDNFVEGIKQLNDYGERLAAKALARLQPGEYRFTDYLDDDGFQQRNIPLMLTLLIRDGDVVLDFTGCADQVKGNLNCPLAVTAAAAFYAFRCLMDPQTPACSGVFRRIRLVTLAGTIVDAQRPAAVAAGNVETSTRLVDLIFGALAQALPDAIPAASQGSMNNVAMGQVGNQFGGRWDYYETLAGGTGGGPRFPGLDGVHSHMTNTLNTPVESVEMHYPLRIRRYQLRRGSGGRGRHRGGNGLIREYEFLAPTRVTLLTERRHLAPWGLSGGSDGAPGVNLLNGHRLPGKCSLSVNIGDRLELHTPGGGGYSTDRPDLAV